MTLDAGFGSREVGMAMAAYRFARIRAAASVGCSRGAPDVG